MKIFASIIGSSGKMGKAIEKLAPSLDICIVKSINKKNFTSLSTLIKKSNVLIDFSHPSSLNNILLSAKKNNLPLIIGTTGYKEKDFDEIKKASLEIPLLYSSNFSIGIALLKSFCKKASNILETSDIDIIEKHHIFKKDKPSGTAISLKNVMQKPSKKINIHSVRAGDIVGEHIVSFTQKEEILELKHTATTRDVFAKGALLAAKFIIDKKPKLYTMEDFLKFSFKEF